MHFFFMALIKHYPYRRRSLCAFCAAYSCTEADVSSQCLLEASVSTEVCLTVLDTLNTFIMGFKVLTETANMTPFIILFSQ